ncbi:PilN domain-containing protein [Aquabacterium sp.]|uniref:PilN domain-containing protein n=1 Tax=Aquabacterium sp. TaxID=1872578 RepID=UPI002C5FF553|nr:PilN domain-containing protein [Aquabacterium sp.]HSW07100.1 PilN domain-containing protein [Aquabacterium sp.]
MILINLLPHREERRRQRKRAFFAGLGAAAVAGVAAAGVWYVVLQQMTAAQQSRNAFLSAEIKRLELQIKDIAELKSEIEGLKARQKAVEDLQTNRNVPVYLLDELVRYTPEGIYFTTVKQVGDIVTVTGVAQTNERVSEFLRNAQNQSQWLRRPELVEIKAVNLPPTAGSREQRRLFDFSVRVSLTQPAAAQPAAPASAASAPPKAA